MAMQTLEHLFNSQSGIPEPWRRELNPAVTGCPRAVLLGLPCAHCKAYFAADLEVCPLCGCKERVSSATTLFRLARKT
jgi:hypothetical protein